MGLNPSGLGRSRAFGPVAAEDLTVTNALVWQRDGNSPQTETNVGSDTYTLAGTYDIVRVEVFIEHVGTSSTTVDMRVNGDSGSNYRHVNNADSSTASATEIAGVVVLGANDATVETMEIDGRWSGTWRSGKEVPDGATGRTVGWDNGNITSPLDSITLIGSENFDIRWAVYGKDIGAGGEP